MNLAETLAGLRERIQQRLEGRLPEVPDFRPPSLDKLADLRGTAENLAPAVGEVNPRPPGLHNRLVQGVKHVLAWSLRWFARPQREFNRALLDALSEMQQLFADQNRNLLVVAQVAAEANRAPQQVLAELERLRELVETGKQEHQKELREQGRSLDGRITSNVTRLDAERKALDTALVENVKRLNDALNGLQEAFWKDFARYREQLEYELRLVRQRLRSITAAETAPGAAAVPAVPTPASPEAPAFDYPHFEERFRGSEQEIRARQQTYVPVFAQRAPVLDVACGRGEFLRLLRESGIEARGVDLDPDMVARCREQHLEVALGDAFAYLESLSDESVGGVFSAQFIEHLPTAGYVRLIQLAYQKLRRGGALLLETQNPECLAIFSQSFFLDPTHVRPVPAAQLRFWMEEAGFRNLATHYVSPLAPRLPELPLLESALGNEALEHWNREAQRFNRTYFGYQDYAVVGIKP